VKADYEAMASTMNEVKRRFGGKRIGYPLIGAGLAGGDWSIIASIINRALDGETHTLVGYAG
jgi:O-acetyl-ADP-ribose deacetylase (regulator of RNase III)